MKNKVISKKVLIFVSITLMLFSSIIILYYYLDLQKKLAQEEQDYYDTFKFSYNKILTRHTNSYLEKLNAIVDANGVKEALLNRDRETLYKLCIDRWETLKRQNRFLTVMHFHLPDGTSFLRMHRPDKYGDHIASIRPMVAAVHKQREVLHGFEEGVYQIPYRTLTPIFQEGKYIGALELGSRPDQLLYEMEYFLDLPGAFFIKNERLGLYRESSDFQIDGYTLQYRTDVHDDLLSELVKQRYRFEDHTFIQFKGKRYNIYTFDLQDFQKNVTAKLVFFEETTLLSERFFNTFIELILLMAGVSVWLVYIIHLGFSKIIGMLDTTNHELVKNQKFMQSILDNSKQSVVVTDVNGKIVLFNKTAQRLLGYRESELIKAAKTPLFYFDKVMVTQRCKALSEELNREVEPIELITYRGLEGVDSEEWNYLHKDGSLINVKLQIKPLQDKYGNISGFLIFSDDISEKKRLIKELRIQKDEYATMLKTVQDGIAILDREGRFVYFNPAYRQLTGYNSEELNVINWIKLGIESEKGENRTIIEQVLQGKTVEHFEYTFIDKQGNLKLVDTAMAPMPDQQRVILTTRDITESKRNEKQIVDYVKLVDENIITSSTDLNGTITYVSEAFSKISGYSKEELIGKNHRIVKHPDMDKDVYTELWQTLSRDKTWKGELKNKKKGGGFYWVEATISPIYNDDNEKIGYTAIRQDITDKKRIEELSITDGLTQIYNRRHFINTFPQVIEEAKRTDELICFLLMDIDHFKQYNDNYGHQKGDDAIIMLAKTLKDTLHRKDDLCFRLGGEEFGVVFKSTSKESAQQLSELIRTNIKDLGIVHEHSTAADVMTVSMGLACHHASGVDDMDMMYKEADELLYEAKENGRNRLASLCTDAVDGGLGGK